MANIFDRFLDSMKLYEDDDEDEDDLALEEEEEKPREKAAKPSVFSRRPIKEDPEDEDAPASPVKSSPAAAAAPRRGSSVVNMRQSRSASNMEVCMVKPTSMEDARDITDILLSGRACVINMEGVQVDLAQRIIDFSSGATYSLKGNLQKISGVIFIVTPASIELSGDFQDVLGKAKAVDSTKLR